MSAPVLPASSPRAFRMSGSTIARVLLVGLAAAVASLVPGAIAHAHTDFASSTPADGETVDGPVDEIVIEFTNPAEPSGDRFTLLDSSGTVREPTSVDPTDGTRFVLSFDPPLTDGTHVVRWEVRAGDAHPIDGSFTFDVTGAPPTTPTTVSPSTTAVADTVTSAPVVGVDDFLGADGAGGRTDLVGPISRVLNYSGFVLGAGAVAALVWVVRGRRDELRAILAWVRLTGIVIAAGGVIALADLGSTLGEPLRDVLDTKSGVAALLEIVGGLAVWFGFHARAGSITSPARSVSAAVIDDVDVARSAPTDLAPTDDDARHRWRPDASATPGLVGLAIVVAASWFDGHTASRGPWPVHAAVNSVHLLAAACWAGTVVVITALAFERRRRDDASDVEAMVGRFAGPATASLVAVTIAGVIMTWLVVDGFGEITSTDWGRLLIVKTVAVALAAALGGYHRFRVHPLLDAAPGDRRLAALTRRLLVAESLAFAAVITITAWLVFAAV